MGKTDRPSEGHRRRGDKERQFGFDFNSSTNRHTKKKTESKAKKQKRNHKKKNANDKRNSNKGSTNKSTSNNPIIISEDEDSYGDEDNSIYGSIDSDVQVISDDDDNDDTNKKTEEDYIALNLSEENDTNSTDSSSTHNQQRGRKRQREDDVYNENDDDDEGNDLTHLYPWWQPYSGRPENRLQAEVEHFVDYLQPLKHEILLRHYLIHKIRYIIQEQWPDAEVQVFGSFKTNTFLPDSDMDLAVTLPVYQGNSTLYALARDLKQAGACLGSPEVIASASVPVIKFVESLTHIKVDIIISSRNGVECAEYVSEVLDQYPGARKLTLIVKHMVALRNLNEVFTGGIGGFGLVCMVISFLQMHPKVASGMIDPEKNLGVLLLDFLQLYGIQFAIGSVGISVVGSGSYYYQRSFCRRKGRPIFSIEDPLDSSNDIGSKSFNAVAVVKLFRNAYLTTFTKTLNVVAKSRGGKGKNRSSFTSNDTNSSLLSSGIAMIPETMINQRSLMQQVYSSRRWKHEPASNSFDWNMAV